MRHIETRGEFPGLNEGGVSEHLQCPLVPASGPLTVGRNDETHRGVLTLSPSSLLTGAFRHLDRQNRPGSAAGALSSAWIEPLWQVAWYDDVLLDMSIIT